MKRLRKENINTPEYFDKEWKDPVLHWWNSGRMRALIKMVRYGDTVLDVGCGMYGAVEWIWKVGPKNCELHCIDFSGEVQEYIQKTIPGVHFHLGNIEKLPYKDNMFDQVLCGEVIEHMENPAALVKEMIRVVKPGGWITLSTVDTNCENARKLEYPEHVWEYTPEDLTGFFGEGATYELLPDYHFIYYRKP
jgi:ubiquinone/menaquinone biosynthesis C-methylase UbiE